MSSFPEINPTTGSRRLQQSWRFLRAEAGPAADTTSWDRIAIPHTWNAEDAQDGDGQDMDSKTGYYRGPGWYQTDLVLGKDLTGSRLFLRFRGAGSMAEVWINGIGLGSHLGAFGAFCFEITDYALLGRSNDLRVRVDNTWRDDLPPLSGDFPVFGGLYRPVELIVKPSLCLSPLQRGSHGVFLRQARVDQTRASLQVQALLSNSGPVATAELCYTLEDAEGREVARLARKVSVPASEQQFDEAVLEVANPRLWNARRDPHLYTLRVELLRDGKAIDCVSIKQGFRFFEVDPEKGFFLNGEPYPLWGVNKHQDRENKGWAISDNEMREDLDLIEEIGARAVRLAHYPHDEFVYQLCDEKGILVTAELPLVNKITGSNAFTGNATDQMNEIIDLYGNHTCVFAYGIQNEIYNAGKTDPPEALVKDLHELCKRRDSTRLTYGATWGGDSERGKQTELSKIFDLHAFNGYPGWYSGTSADLRSEIRKWNELGGNRGVGIAEYGAGASIKHQESSPKPPHPGGKWHPEGVQRDHHEVQFEIIKNTPAVWGSFVWNMFDFASDWRNEGDRPGINDKGLVTHDRKIRKDAFWFYKANWSHVPVLYLTDLRHVHRVCALTDVKVYSNCGRVTLTVNGKTLGTKEPNAMRIVVFKDIALEAGSNLVEVAAGGHTARSVWTFNPSATPSQALQGH